MLVYNMPAAVKPLPSSSMPGIIIITVWSGDTYKAKQEGSWLIAYCWSSPAVDAAADAGVASI